MVAGPIPAADLGIQTVRYDQSKLGVFELITDKGIPVKFIGVTSDPDLYPGPVVVGIIRASNTDDPEHVVTRYYDAANGGELPIGVRQPDRKDDLWRHGSLLMREPMQEFHVTVYLNDAGRMVPVIHEVGADLDRYLDAYAKGIIVNHSFQAPVGSTAATRGSINA